MANVQAFQNDDVIGLYQLFNDIQYDLRKGWISREQAAELLRVRGVDKLADDLDHMNELIMNNEAEVKLLYSDPTPEGKSLRNHYLDNVIHYEKMWHQDLQRGLDYTGNFVSLFHS
jgi:hypothetical protein